MPEILEGVPLQRFEDPIAAALDRYEEYACNGLMFKKEEAARLTLTPDKPNSARSDSPAIYFGKEMGRLYVIAFKPGDGTGDEEHGHTLDELYVPSPYPRESKIVPRNKTGIHSEVHLTIATHKIADSHADPILYGGQFELLGITPDDELVRIGILGQLEKRPSYQPVATYTVGGRGAGRFGDPHAVYSRVADSIQVCAFLAVSDQMHALNYNPFRELFPHSPIK